MIFSFSGFRPNPWGHGGEKRTHQIDCTLLKGGLSAKGNLFDVVGSASGLKKEKKILCIMQGMDCIRRHFGYWRAVKMANNSRYLLEIGYFKTSLRKLSEPEPHVILWENTTSRYWYVPFIANEMGYKVVALPQNLESMVPGQKSKISGTVSPYWLNEEIAALRKCDIVFCISRYDQWLLQILGIDADYFPYYPEDEILSFLSSIRNQRKSHNVPANKLVLFGTVHNRPTLEGMKEIIEILEQRNIEFSIAGYGTEELRDFVRYPEKSTVLGSVESECLSELLVCAACVLVHQQYSSGCLTRIMELLIAGVPVVANPAAARNYENVDGVYIYNNTDELEAILDSTMPVPAFPAKRNDNKKRLLDAIQSEIKMY